MPRALARLTDAALHGAPGVGYGRGVALGLAVGEELGAGVGVWVAPGVATGLGIGADQADGVGASMTAETSATSALRLTLPNMSQV